MKIALIIVAVVVGIAAVFVALTYPRYHREMQAAKVRLLSGSEILKTDHGTIEYAVQGEGTPVLTLHGAGGGYDQGLWLGKMALGDGYKFISVSRYGYLRTPIPTNASIKTQAALYKDLLDHLNIQKVIGGGGSAGGLRPRNSPTIIPKGLVRQLCQEKSLRQPSCRRPAPDDSSN